MTADGRVAIVTGGAGGIGSATTERLVSEGAVVAVADHNRERAEALVVSMEGPGRAFVAPVEVTDVDSVRATVRSVEEEAGPVDLLVNTAGWDRIGPFVDSDADMWDQALAVNLFGPIACTHAVLGGMMERGSGVIVSVASDAGRVGSSGEVVYSAAKGGVIAFTKAVAREVARYGIRVNCVAPGPTDTPFLDIFEGQEKIIEGI
ncbi:MAG TPA: SDR family oxidoreductase, partial [Longimicrobiales bacterium]|nr:SDR family oxidoreductase [Longimicrobiales bacterium]